MKTATKRMRRPRPSKAELDRLFEAIAAAPNAMVRKECQVRYLMAYYRVTRRIAEGLV